jgi:hypothetical protein
LKRKNYCSKIKDNDLVGELEPKKHNDVGGLKQFKTITEDRDSNIHIDFTSSGEKIYKNILKRKSSTY